jgi:hypothetical protein
VLNIWDAELTVKLFHIGFHIYIMGLLTLYIRDLELIISYIPTSLCVPSTIPRCGSLKILHTFYCTGLWDIKITKRPRFWQHVVLYTECHYLFMYLKNIRCATMDMWSNFFKTCFWIFLFSTFCDICVTWYWWRLFLTKITLTGEQYITKFKAILTAEQYITKSCIFWNITPCSPLKVSRRFGGSCCHHLLGRRISQASISLLATCFTLFSYMASSILKMEATCSSEMSVDFQQITWHCIPDDRNLHNNILHST